MVLWLRLYAPYARGPASIPGHGTGSHVPQLRPDTAKQISKNGKKTNWRVCSGLSVNPPKAAPSELYLARVPRQFWAVKSSGRTSQRRCRGKKAPYLLCSGKTSREMVPVSQLWKPVQRTAGPGKRRNVFWPFQNGSPPPAVGPRGPPSVPAPSTRGDAGSNRLTLRSRCRRMGLVLGQQAVSQPVICSTNTAGCPALPARGGALVTVPGTQGGCGNLSGAGLRLSVALSRRLLGRRVWRSPQDGGGAGVTGLALFLSWEAAASQHRQGG